MKQREIVQKIGKAGVHVWLGNLPARFSFEPTDWLTHSIEMKHTAAYDTPRRAGLRLLIHDRSGQLGVEYIPQIAESLTVRVGIGDQEIPKLMVRKGIHAQYARTILDEVIKTAGEIEFLGAGTLEFVHGAFDPVYSSKKIFAVLARTTLLLLDPALEDVQEDSILAVVAQGIDSYRTG